MTDSPVLIFPVGIDDIRIEQVVPFVSKSLDQLKKVEQQILKSIELKSKRTFDLAGYLIGCLSQSGHGVRTNFWMMIG